MKAQFSPEKKDKGDPVRLKMKHCRESEGVTKLSSVFFSAVLIFFFNFYFILNE